MLTELWSDLRYRLRALVCRHEVERELDDELRFHLEREAEKYEQLGIPRADAMRRARLALGGMDRAKEESRDVRGTVLLETIIQDIRYAVRGLRAKPAFTAGVIVTLALGIGANASMFGIMDRFLFRAPPYLVEAEHVHRVYLSRMRDGVRRIDDGFQYPRYRDLVRGSTGLANAAAFVSWHLAVGDGETARERMVVGATASYFAFFDAPPALGRYFSTREDSIPEGSPLAVLGHRFWQQELGGRAGVLGEQLRVDHTLCTIIGVAPAGFRGVEETIDPDVYIPLSTFGNDVRGPSYVDNYGFHWIGAIVRRKAGVTEATVQAELSAAFLRSWLKQAAATSESPRALSHLEVILGPVQFGRGPLAGPESRLVAWTGGVTLIVLLIACANVANLLLARAILRRREIALRCALGVSRARLIRQLLTEALVLASIGGIAGLVIAQWGGALIKTAFLPADLTMNVIADRHTLLVALAATLLAGVATGLAPVLHALNAEPSRALTGAGRDTGLRSSRGRAALLVLQAALSVVLLVGAGLFVRSLQRVRALRLGYDVDPVLLVMSHKRGVLLDTASGMALERRLVDAARTLPGVVGASVVSSVPFWGFEGHALYVPGVDSVDLLGNFDMQTVSAGYFTVVGTRILRGRSFDERDHWGAGAVIIVSEGMAKALWPGQEALGKCIYVASRNAPCASVIGIAEDLRLHTLSKPREYSYYLPIEQFPMSTGMLFVRTNGDPTQFAESVRRRLQTMMPGASYVTVQPFRDVIDPAIRSWRVGATIFVAFGGLALLLAGVGLYSVIAYGVAQRRREIGVRIALGASAASVVQLVVRGGVRLIVLGILLGTVIAFVAGRGIAALLFQESPNDPVVYLTVAAVLVLVSLVSTAAPAMAASRVDPNLSLRTD